MRDLPLDDRDGAYECCPMCGAKTQEPEASHYTGSEAVLRIAQLFADDPVSTGIMLHKMLCAADPVTGKAYTLQQIGQRIGAMFKADYSRAAINQRCMAFVDRFEGARYLLTDPVKSERRKKAWTAKS